MARLSLRIEMVGQDQFLSSLMSLIEAMNIAHRDEPLEVEQGDCRWRVNGIEIAAMYTRCGGGAIRCTIKPLPDLPLLVAWALTILPASASVEWRSGWPLFRLDRRENDDGEDGPPTDRQPDALVPA